MAAPGKETRQRLSKCLAELTRIKPADLVSRDPYLRIGQRDFQQCLELFQKLARTNLARVPATYLDLVLEHAEKALDHFRKILAFDGAGLENTAEACSIMLNDVRESYRAMYEDLTLVIQSPHGAGQKIAGETNPMTITVITLLASLAVGAILVAYFLLNSEIGQQFLSFFRR